jgi:tetratricopeptide (TPR) repeat protein
LSQEQVGGSTFTRAAVHMVETGKARPSRRMLRQIAKKTKRPISYFLATSQITPEHRQALDDVHAMVASTRFSEAIRLAEPLLDADLPQEVEAELRFLVGRAYVRSMDGASAHRHLVRARHLYEFTDDDVQLADVLNQMACALYLCDDPRALRVVYDALDLSDRVRPPQTDLTVRNLIVLGMIYHRMQDWGRAIRTYQRALDVSDDSPGIRNLAMIHDQLSQSYQRVGRFADALDHAQKAMRLYESSPDPTDLVRAHHNLGETLLRQGELRAARPHLEQALALVDERELRHQARGFALLAMIELHLACGELDLAETRLDEACDLVERLGERSHQANAWKLRGRLHAQRGEPDLADRAFATAARMLNELQLPADVLDVLVEHAAVLRRNGQLEGALDVLARVIESSRTALRRLEGGWGDLVANPAGS